MPKKFTKSKTDAIILNIMYKWQQEILNRMANFKGKNMLTVTGRQIGKSIMTANAVERLKDDLGPYQLKLSQIELNGESYYEIRPVGWMHKDELQWNDMITWVVDTFGPTARDGVWTQDNDGMPIMLVFILKISKTEIGLSCDGHKHNRAIHC